MTKQNEYKIIGRIGGIEIGQGFTDLRGEKTFKYPPDRLLTFLKIDTNDTQKVDDFCKKYLFIPRDQTEKTFYEAFREEHEKLTDIFNNWQQNKLTKKDLEIINKELSNIQQNLSANFINKDSYINNKQLYLNTKHLNSISSLWEDLVRMFVGDSRIKFCKNCGKPLLEPSSRKQYYCDKFCGDIARQKRYYRKHHIKKIKVSRAIALFQTCKIN